MSPLDRRGGGGDLSELYEDERRQWIGARLYSGHDDGILFMSVVETATIMGLGAGSMAKNLLSSFSELKVYAVEYREEVVRVAREHLHLPETDRLVVHIEDAADYLKNTEVQSDLIFQISITQKEWS